ncbi:glycosyltransferase family 2 protein [Maribacter polysaccharolyticus]|uniref:glycosyltransferase family 2 protein n=1 Tax=Maribacter polysaccharolyticus TaxID=3020831 RepID=UPI00237F9C7F|nr:glycosyltransferase family 2 protein [Maribacter polysaccharolyticus]MDE3741498.1 glycosyltransferase family 2 protein [Maribacter polysaccharolyticus]
MNSQDQPLVSIIICFLNEEKFLGEAVNSVLEQDYENWELFLIDDGSSDNSPSIALDFEKKFKGKIHYHDHHNHKNKGLSASRNEGIRKSKGDLVAFLDADDIWLPTKLSEQVAIFNKNPSIGLLAEASSYWYNWDDDGLDNVLIRVGASPDKIYDPPHLMYLLYPLGDGAAPCPSSLMAKRKAIENVGYFEESFKREYALYEDQAFLSKIYLKESVYISSACNNMYRQRQESIVKTVHSAGLYTKVRKYYLEWFMSYLDKNNIRDPQLDLMVKKALRPLKYPILYNSKKKILAKLKSFLKMEM